MHKKSMLSIVLFFCFTHQSVCSDKDYTKEIVQGVTTAVVGAACGAIVGVVKYVYTSYYPDKEQQLRNVNAQEKLIYLEAKKNLIKCLLDNVNVSTNDQDVPKKCEKIWNDFILCGGLDEGKQMLKNLEFIK